MSNENRICYSNDFNVSDLRRAVTRWRDIPGLDNMALRIVDAIDGHSDSDRVRVRLHTTTLAINFNRFMQRFLERHP